MTGKTRAFRQIVLAAALALAAPALAESPALEKAGWTLVTASEDVHVYMRAETARGDVRRVWTAYDAAKPRQRDGFTFQSVKSLGEFDCKKRMSRIVDEIFHDAPGLTGKSWKSPKFEVTPWAAPAPDSVGAIRMAFACRALEAI